MYPSTLDFLANATVSDQNGEDVIALALEAAKAQDMQLYLGTLNDDRWWKYGWGTPALDENGNVYFADWGTENAEHNVAIVTELWERYGDSYAEQIAGFYYVNEIWNMETACLGTDGDIYAKLIGDNIRGMREAVAMVSVDLPMMISPFFHQEHSTAEQYAAFWGDIFSHAHLRTCDIFAHQDGGGRPYDAVKIREWAVALRQSCDTAEVRFWINHENFENGSPKAVAVLQANREATADLTDHCVMFSWNHYYNGAVDADHADEEAAFSAYIAGLGRVRGDINGDRIVSMADLVLSQGGLLGTHSLNAQQGATADLNGNGILQAVDVTAWKLLFSEISTKV